MQHQDSKRTRLEQLPMPADCFYNMTQDRMSIDTRTDIGLVCLVRVKSTSFLCAQKTLLAGDNSVCLDFCVFTEELKDP